MIFTAGVLMLATPRTWRLSIIPVIWSVIGGSAAPLPGVRADYALPIAGIALTIFSLQRRSGTTTVLDTMSCVPVSDPDANRGGSGTRSGDEASESA